MSRSVHWSLVPGGLWAWQAGDQPVAWLSLGVSAGAGRMGVARAILMASHEGAPLPMATGTNEASQGGS